MVNVQSFGDRHTGRRRKNNEDFVAWFEPVEQSEIEASGCLYILADGVGGADKGERASQYAAQKVLHEYYQHPSLEPGERLRQLMMQASDDIYTHAEQNGNFKRMATTMVAAIIHTGKLIVANVGDSRAYLIREGVATQLTRDHSVVGELVAHGDMTEEEAQASKIKNRLTRSIGGDPDVHVDVFKPRVLQPGDKILLCSDGITRYASRTDIAQLTAEGSPQEIVGRLIKFANQCGGADNISAVLIAFGVTEVLQPTIRIPRRPQPPSIEDTLDTIPDFKPRRKLSNSIIWAVLSVVVLFIVGGITLLSLALTNENFELPVLIKKAITTSTPLVTTSIAPPQPLTPTVNPLLSTIPSTTPFSDVSSTPSPMTEQVSFEIRCPLGVNVRESASMDSPSLGYVKAGDPVIITRNAAKGKILESGEFGDWLEIFYPPDSNQKGWIVQALGPTVCVEVNTEDLIFILATPYTPKVIVTIVE